MKFSFQLKIIEVSGLLVGTAAFLMFTYMVVEALYKGQVTFYGRDGNGIAYWIKQLNLFIYGVVHYSVFAAIGGFMAWKALSFLGKDFE
jgi:hypothetical protein